MQSMQMVASRLGWRLDRTEDTVEPVVAQTEVRGRDWSVPAGAATGVNQTGRGFVTIGRSSRSCFARPWAKRNPETASSSTALRKSTLRLPAASTETWPRVSIVANAIPVIHGALPGLRTMVDIAPISAV